MKPVYSIFIITLFIFTGCKSDYTAPCRNQVVRDSVDFTANQLRTIPFSVSDTLVYYAADSTDSVTFYTSGYNNYPVWALSDKPGNPECPNDYIRYQRLSLMFSDRTGGRSMAYRAGRPYDSCYYSVPGKWIDLPLSAVGAADSTYADSIVLGNRTFYGVNRLVSLRGDTFYISSQLGVLQFNINNTVFTLQRFNSKWK
jgi:hypothetical protein